MVQEVAKCAAGERLIVACVQDEFMPQLVGNLGRHGDILLAAFEIRQKELAKTMAHQLHVPLRQVGYLRWGWLARYKRLQWTFCSLSMTVTKISTRRVESA